MEIQPFEDYEKKPCMYCGTETVCLFKFRDRKLFVCQTCFEERLAKLERPEK